MKVSKVKITSTRASEGSPVTIHHVEVRGPRGSWTGTTTSGAYLHGFLEGVKALSAASGVETEVQRAGVARRKKALRIQGLSTPAVTRREEMPGPGGRFPFPPDMLDRE